MDIILTVIRVPEKNTAWAERNLRHHNEAVSANQLLLDHEVSKPLTERIQGHGSVSFHEFLDRYETILKARGLREKTLKDYR